RSVAVIGASTEEGSVGSTLTKNVLAGERRSISWCRAARHAILVMNCPTALASSSDAAQAVIDAIGRAARVARVPPILTDWLGEEAVAEARRKFREAAIPTYESPTDAVKGFLYLWQHTKAQEALMRTPPR